MPANFFANTNSTKTSYAFSGVTSTANLAFSNTSNVSTTSSFGHSAKSFEANTVSNSLNVINRPVKGQLYPR